MHAGATLSIAALSAAGALSLLAPRVATGEGANGEADRIREMVRGLESSEYEDRWIGRDTLLAAGSNAVPVIEAALRGTHSISAEAMRTMKAILASLAGPTNGVVYRQPTGPAPAGLRDGDIIVKIAGEDAAGVAREYAREADMAGPTNALPVRSVALTLWRAGVGRVETNASLDRHQSSSMFPVPDTIHGYLLLGVYGIWDAKVIHALYLNQMGDYPSTAQVMEEAFSEGCQDPFAFAAWIDATHRGSKPEDVRRIIVAYAGQLKTYKDKCIYVYGHIPRLTARTYHLLGNMEKARSIADAAIRKAKEAGFDEAVNMLLDYQMSLYLSVDHKAARDYLGENRTDIARYLKGNEPAVGAFATHLAAEGQPALAIEFLSIFKGGVPEKTLRHFTQQEELARTHSNETAVSSWIPFWYDSREYPKSAPLGRYEDAPLSGLKLTGACRLDCTLRLTAIPRTESRTRASMVNLNIAGQGHGIMVGFDRRSSLRIGESVGEPEDLRIFVGNPKTPRSVSIRIAAHAVQVYCDGVPVFTKYFKDPFDPAVEAWALIKEGADVRKSATQGAEKPMKCGLQTAGCSSAIKDLVAYVPTSARIDTDAALTLLRGFDAACDDGGFEEAQTALAELDTMLKPAKEAQTVLRSRRRQLAVLNGSEEPTLEPLLTEGLRAAVSFSHGECRFVKDWVELSRKNTPIDTKWWGGTVTFPVKLNNVELFGLIDWPANCTNGTVHVHWNTTRWEDGDNHFMIVPEKGIVTFGVWKGGASEIRRQIGPLDGQVSFCIRIRGDKAALFVGSGDKPVAVASSLRNPGDQFSLNVRNWGDERVRIGHLSVRGLPIKKPLDAPVELLPVEKPAKNP